MRVILPLRAALASGLALGCLTTGGAAPSYAVDTECGNIPVDQEKPLTTERSSSPMELMQVARAQGVLLAQGRKPGSGVRVAVLDSGVAPSSQMTVIEGVRTSKTNELLDYQGTAIAGLIAGRGTPEKPIGVAPYAEIVDVRVYDRRVSDDTNTQAEPTIQSLVAGLEFLAGLPRGTVDVANISAPVARDRSLDDAIAAVVAKDIVVVAASGDRPEESGPFYSEFGYAGQEDPPYGEDARSVVWPAGNPSVVAVNATATVMLEGEPSYGDAVDAVLQNSATDVAAPTLDAVTIGLDGESTCLLTNVSTAWAAAEVSGVVALLRSAYPRESAAKIIARLESTATGSPRASNVLTGHGVVQPLEAVTRPLRPNGKGRVPTTQVADQGNERAEAPRPEPDVLASTKTNVVWWGLLAGGALVVAVLLRPVLARRRE